MPIIHVVLVKFAPGLTENEIQSWKTLAIERLSVIPLVQKFEIGTKLPNAMDKGYDNGFVITFNSADDLNAYVPHLDHKTYIEAARKFVTDVLVFDIQT